MNPAFDITPHRYVAAIVTERGIARAIHGIACEASVGTHMRFGIGLLLSKDNVRERREREIPRGSAR